MRLFQKILTRLRGTNFCTSSARFAPSKATKQSQMHPNRTKRTKTRVQSPIRRIGCVRCEKSGRDFAAPSFALIAPVHPVLHQVCSYKTIPNAPKHYETHQNMSLRSYDMDRVDLLQKILTQLCGLNFYINYNSSARVELSIVKQRNGPKCPQTLQNKTKHEFRVQWGWINCIRCEKFGHDFVA